MGRACGLEVDELTPAQAKALYPLIEVGDLVGAIRIPADGQANPIDIAQALAKGARQSGARIVEGCKVTGILRRRGRVSGVATERGAIRADVVVNCAGMWGREVGRMAGASVPLHACEHFYVLTEPMPEVPPDLPVLRDPDGGIYVKEDAGKLLLGAFEPVAKPWGMNGIPDDFEFGELPEDWDHFMPVLEDAMRDSISELDGVFTYIVATADSLGMAKDVMAAKPMVLYESDTFIALASEEVAIRSVFPHEIDTWDPYEGEVRVWKAQGARA